MKKGFTLVELLVVISVMVVLMTIALPSIRRVREQALETVCQSNLRQMEVVMKTYLNDEEGSFPSTQYLYHSACSFGPQWSEYPECCRWHDERMAMDSLLLQDHPELRGALWSYLGNKDILVCKVGKQINRKIGCYNTCTYGFHRPDIEISPQYTYTMNSILRRSLLVGRPTTGNVTGPIVPDTYREYTVYRESQVTRSPSQVVLFGEQNSWAMNKKGLQECGEFPELASAYNLSYPGVRHDLTLSRRLRASLCLSAIDIMPTYSFMNSSHASGTSGSATIALNSNSEGMITTSGFATYHRPKRGNMDTGHSYAVMLDGHTRKITVSDQLRHSQQVPGIEPSSLGPGGNVALVWPLDIAPPGEWENQ